MKKLIFIILITASLISSLQAQDSKFYIKKSTWFETLYSSFEALYKYEKEVNSKIKIEFGKWFALDPLPSSQSNAFEEKFEPENDFSLSKEYYSGKTKWKERSDYQDDVVNDFPELEYTAFFLQRTIVSDRDTVIKGYFGSDDGLKVWFNGDQIISDNANRGCYPNQAIADLKLKKGTNQLVLKINNNQGPTAFYFSKYERNPKSVIWSILEKDFSSPQNVLEIAWEKRDEIWNGEFEPSNYSKIALKYAEAIKQIDSGLYNEITKSISKAASLTALKNIHDKYLKAHRSEYVVLTPKPSPKPQINGAKVYGVRPGSPFLYIIPATGKRPMEFSVNNLPAGLSVDKNTGIITGTLKETGDYKVTLVVKNNLGSAERKFKIVCGEQIALTPPLGWNSWNCFASAVSDEKVRSAADAMVKSGLINHGWSYINIDDFWEIRPKTDDPTLQGEARDANGFINSNKRFPDMKKLSDYIHGKGMKMGIYSSPGPLTCGGCTASFGHEEKDAQRFGEWGVDYLKYDWCSYNGDTQKRDELMKPYTVMRKALDKINRDIVFSLCQYGMGNVWEWGEKVGGNCWRTTGDITDSWQSMSSIGFNQDGHEKYAGPGHWNDPDMLVVGMVGWGPSLHPTRLTPNEQYTHISLWSLLSSPLLIGCDMTQLDEFTLGLLTNDEVLDVNQDPLGKPAGRIWKEGDFEIWARDLEDGSKAVGLFNKSSANSEMKLDLNLMKISGSCIVRDLWRQKDIGKFKDSFKTMVPTHGVVLVKISSI